MARKELSAALRHEFFRSGSGTFFTVLSLLLADASSLVRDIGQDVGFLTIQTFIRVFKAKTGVTPSEYRSTLPKNS